MFGSGGAFLDLFLFGHTHVETLEVFYSRVPFRWRKCDEVPFQWAALHVRNFVGLYVLLNGSIVNSFLCFFFLLQRCSINMIKHFYSQPGFVTVSP